MQTFMIKTTISHIIKQNKKELDQLQFENVRYLIKRREGCDKTTNRLFDFMIRNGGPDLFTFNHRTNDGTYSSLFRFFNKVKTKNFICYPFGCLSNFSWIKFYNEELALQFEQDFNDILYIKEFNVSPIRDWGVPCSISDDSW